MTDSQTSQSVHVSALHNNLFVYGLSDPEIAQDLIRSVLPATAVQHLNLATLTRQGETFVDPELRDSYADLLFECQWARPLPSGLPEADSQRANIYILLEHKSEPESKTLFQLLRYMVRIWEGHARTGKRLGPIIPIVIYHGEREWVRGRTMEQLLNYPPELQAFAVSFSFPLLDLWRKQPQKSARMRFCKRCLPC